MITVVAKKEFFIRATGLLPNIIYYELLKLIYAYTSCPALAAIRVTSVNGCLSNKEGDNIISLFFFLI